MCRRSAAACASALLVAVLLTSASPAAARRHERLRRHDVNAAAVAVGSAVALGNRLLSVGSSGPDVVQLQELLRSRGFSVSADGIFGPLTQAAVERAQRAYHLTVDGIVGPKTLAALRHGPPPHSSWSSQALGSRLLSIGMRGSDVRSLQQLLSKRGFRVTADGIFGPATRGAVEAAQGAYGLTPDGIVGSKTLGALRHGAPRHGSCGSTPGSGSSVTRWRPVVSCVLGLLGQPRTNSYINDVLIIINYESGGNPSAINLWDSNARNGDPSRGLMQLIGTNFSYYRSHSLPNNIYDPAANIYAALRYALARYGSIPNIPGVRSVNAGGHYVPYQPVVVRRHRFAHRSAKGGAGAHWRRRHHRAPH